MASDWSESNNREAHTALEHFGVCVDRVPMSFWLFYTHQQHRQLLNIIAFVEQDMPKHYLAL